ncbi:MAG: hypothetical protein JWR80_3308 [Bradyrhizobium sp.]|nr:hypothetical protein [Bradyrhizobium sp.]
MSGFLSRLLHRAGIANAADEEISLLRYRIPARFEPSGLEPAAPVESVESDSATPAASAAASGVREFPAASDAIGVTPPFAQPGIRASLDVKAPAVSRGPPVRAPGSSIDFDAAPKRTTEAAAAPDHPIPMPDRRSRFEGHSPEVPAAPVSRAAPPTLPPKAPGNADQHPLTPHPQPVRRREVPSKDLLPSNAPQPSVAASGIRRIETPPVLNAALPQQTEPPPPETIIQIARVEIVASQPELRRTVAPVSRKPTTSLSDYLARRRR